MYAYLLAAALPALVSAHGHVAGVLADGVYYPGWNPALSYNSPIPPTVGWQAANLDNGFVTPSSFGSADIVCHKSAKSNGASVSVKAGSKITLMWNTWPEGHKGPVFDYLAPCGGDCGSVAPTSLLFTKIDELAWVSGVNPGTWGTDKINAASNFSWTTTVPSSLAAGNYVLRHEIMSLHSAGSANGAQAYPQCINLKVTGSGSTTLSGGVAATTFYSATNPGVLFNLYQTFTSYTVPGPAVKTIAKKARDHARSWLS